MCFQGNTALCTWREWHTKCYFFLHQHPLPAWPSSSSMLLLINQEVNINCYTPTFFSPIENYICISNKKNLKKYLTVITLKSAKNQQMSHDLQSTPATWCIGCKLDLRLTIVTYTAMSLYEPFYFSYKFTFYFIFLYLYLHEENEVV